MLLSDFRDTKIICSHSSIDVMGQISQRSASISRLLDSINITPLAVLNRLFREARARGRNRKQDSQMIRVDRCISSNVGKAKINP